MSTTTTLLIGGTALAVLLLVGMLCGLVVLAERQRRALAQAAEVVERLEGRVDELESSVRRLRERQRQQDALDGVIVDEDGVVSVASEQAEPARPVPDQIVLSATLGEPLVKAAAFGHGVRRAMRPATLNRIRFAMRQEVRRSRKQRRRDMKAAYRTMQMQQAGETT